MNNSIHILLIDDHTLFRESLVRLLEAEPDIQVVAHCANVSDGIRVLRNNKIDVILLDYDLGEETGAALFRELGTCESAIKVMMVTAGMSDNATREALHAGVAGIIFKHSGPAQLTEAIHKVAKGETWLDSNAMCVPLANTKEQFEGFESTRPLTDRQREVLHGILDGLTNKEIAWKLQVSETSVKAVIQELFHKAGVRTRSQLVRIAIEKHSTDWLRLLPKTS